MLKRRNKRAGEVGRTSQYVCGEEWDAGDVVSLGLRLDD